MADSEWSEVHCRDCNMALYARTNSSMPTCQVYANSTCCAQCGRAACNVKAHMNAALHTCVLTWVQSNILSLSSDMRVSMKTICWHACLARGESSENNMQRQSTAYCCFAYPGLICWSLQCLSKASRRLLLASVCHRALCARYCPGAALNPDSVL